jgi:methionyl-tRNA synthetase
VANLAPKDLKGILSHGMILMAEDSDGKLAFVACDETMPNGSVIR